MPKGMEYKHMSGMRNHGSKGPGAAKENPVKGGKDGKGGPKDNPVKKRSKMDGLGYSGPHATNNCAKDNPLRKGKKGSSKMGYEKTYSGK
jgi:hypothetical protein